MIVVAGEALVDMTPVAVDGCVAYVPRPGGSPMNVAVGLGRLGVDVSFLARLSRDRFGRMLRAHLLESRVGLELVADADDPSTLAFVHLSDGEPEYAFYAEQTADRLLQPADVGQLPDGAPLHLGANAMMLEPSATTLGKVLAREAGSRLTSLDPNIRPSLIPDADAYRARFSRWLSDIDVLKLSVADLGWLRPGTSVDGAVAGWLREGPALVLVTDGSAGARAFTRSFTTQVATPQVTVVDTVGAGDAFMAGALAYLDDAGKRTREDVEACTDDALRSLLHHATEIAADACTRPGAEPPWR